MACSTTLLTTGAPFQPQRIRGAWQHPFPIDRRVWAHTVRNDWSSDEESAWIRVAKFSLYNQLFLSDLLHLFASRDTSSKPEALDLRCASTVSLTRMGRVLQVSPETLVAGFCVEAPMPVLSRANQHLRFCAKCMESGFHSALFQWDFVGQCPIHKTQLIVGCPACQTPIPYFLDSKLAAKPLQCTACSLRLVPNLHNPAGW